MKKDATQLQILLMLGTTFSSRQLCEKEASKNNKPLSPKEKLEEACWNGWLHEMLPEIFGDGAPSKLYIWKISNEHSFLTLEMSDYPREISRYFSIDPYSFLEGLSHN